MVDQVARGASRGSRARGRVAMPGLGVHGEVAGKEGGLHDGGGEGGGGHGAAGARRRRLGIGGRRGIYRRGR